MSLNEIFTLDPGSMLWTLLSFLLLLLILGKVAWKPILTALHRREEGIRENIASAQRDREEAAKSKTAHEESLEHARQEAQTIVGDSREHARQYESEQMELAQEEVRRMKERAGDEIELQSRKAMQGLQAELVDITLQAAEQVIRRRLSLEDHEAIIRESLKTSGGNS